MNKSKILLFGFVTALAIVGALSCSTYNFRTNYNSANTLLHGTENLKEKPYLKAHLKDGSVCILKDSWEVDTLKSTVSGFGKKYDFNRTELFTGKILIPLENVLIFETNKKIDPNDSPRFAAPSILAGVNVGIGLFCLSNPKACFGSCPTFYLNEDDNFHYADAEGFSNAILQVWNMLILTLWVR